MQNKLHVALGSAAPQDLGDEPARFGDRPSVRPEEPDRLIDRPPGLGFQPKSSAALRLYPTTAPSAPQATTATGRFPKTTLSESQPNAVAGFRPINLASIVTAPSAGHSCSLLAPLAPRTGPRRGDEATRCKGRRPSNSGRIGLFGSPQPKQPPLGSPAGRQTPNLVSGSLKMFAPRTPACRRPGD